MSDAMARGSLLAAAITPLLSACGDGGAASQTVSRAPQCSGMDCGTQGVPGSTPVAPLCPADADIGEYTFVGGAGSGEAVSLAIDDDAVTYTLKWPESPIPLRVGKLTPTRCGTTISGAVKHSSSLPSAEQNRCAFDLQAGSETTAADGSAHSSAATFNPDNPPSIFVGHGEAGGGIPGAEIQYPGILGLFAVPDRKFDRH